jgi:hypothetical protein
LLSVGGYRCGWLLIGILVADDWYVVGWDEALGLTFFLFYSIIDFLILIILSNSHPIFPKVI